LGEDNVTKVENTRNDTEDGSLLLRSDVHDGARALGVIEIFGIVDPCHVVTPALVKVVVTIRRPQKHAL
jgi:hypothetical protein